jgi:hypothetical protein
MEFSMLKSLPVSDSTPRPRGTAAGVLVAALALTVVGCSRLTDVAPPSNIVDPGTAATQEAAVSMYTGALYKTSLALGGLPGITSTSFVAVSGLFSDEFTTQVLGSDGDYDTHKVTAQEENNNGPYELLNAARIAADQAITNLGNYTATTPASYRAEMHALKGYIYVMFSELYCSGIPFSYLVPGGNLVYGAAESKTQMLDDAVAQFDSALTLAADSARIVQFAAVGKGRAYLDLGAFDSAAAAVASVPTSFAYQFGYSTAQQTYSNFLANETTTGSGPSSVSLFMSDREGGNGINYVSSNDPRVASFLAGGRPLPSKYSTPSAPIVLASGIEARLIEAEAALRAHDVAGWAGILNTLRTNGSFTTKDTVVGTLPDTMTVQDTLWFAGTGNVAGVGPLPLNQTINAPNDSIRADVMFRERAMWLYGTGHRQGDMRRLIAQYQRQATNVYPGGIQTYLYVPQPYVQTTNLPAPQSEETNNLNYHGCINRDA